jgi:DNA polymerase III alpha subunit
MIKNKFSELVFDENDIFNLVMQGTDVLCVKNLTISQTVELENLIQILEDPRQLATWTRPTDDAVSVSDYDAVQQQNWHMPTSYKELDIAEYVLGLCKTQEELQRCGTELILFQERNMFDLLRYMKYLVDTMRDNNVIWGVGRGSSVASYVLYLLGVHRVNSMYYNLDPGEFLR